MFAEWFIPGVGFHINVTEVAIFSSTENFRK